MAPSSEHEEARDVARDERLRRGKRDVRDERGRPVEVGDRSIAVSSGEARLAALDFSLRGCLGVAGCERRLDRLREHLLAAPLADAQSPTIGQQTLCVELGELECRGVVTRRGGESIEREGPISGLLERGGCADDELLDIVTGASCVVQSCQVVVSEHLRAVLGTVVGERLDPFGRPPMAVDARSPRHLPVRHVADDHVSERVLSLAGDGRPSLPVDELLALEREQTLLELERLESRERCQRVRPEDLAEDSGVLEKRLLVVSEQV